MSIISFCETSSEVRTPHNMKRKFSSSSSDDERLLPRHCPKQPKLDHNHNHNHNHTADESVMTVSCCSRTTITDACSRKSRSRPKKLDDDDKSTEKTNRIENGTSYWDGLTKVWLTKKALDEVDSRADQQRQRQRQQYPDPIDEDLHRLVPVERIDMKALKRFARQGGPDLRDLSFVSSITIILPFHVAYCVSIHIFSPIITAMETIDLSKISFMITLQRFMDRRKSIGMRSGML